MEDLKLLQDVAAEFKKLLQWGYNRDDATDRLSKKIPKCPYINMDEYRGASYCTKGNYVLIFDDGIYKKI
jgi:hypothetical protein